MRLTGCALLFAAAAVFPLLLDCTPTCKLGNQTGYVEGHCPIRLTSVREPGDMYSECVTIRVWIKADDFKKAPQIVVYPPFTQTFQLRVGKRGCKKPNNKSKNKKNQNQKICCDGGDAQQLQHSNTTFAVWEFVLDCVRANAERVVSVSYNTTSTNCSASHTVEDHAPEFDLSVDRPSKSITVTVEGEEEVYTRWCYKSNAGDCIGSPYSSLLTIDPSQSPSAEFNIPFLLPCVCVQVYYTHRDSRRKQKCPFLKDRLTNAGDVWPSSDITTYESNLKLSSVCPVSDLKISASLCWQQKHLCTSVLNSTLAVQDNGSNLIYDTSAVDKHPKMCVQFSVPGSNNISCPFEADMSSWEVYTGPGRQSVFVYLTSSVPAMFSAQLCVLNKTGCSPMGPVHTLRIVTEGKTTEMRINMPPHLLAEKPCVQVWRSDPALQGRRILCLDYTQKRCGIYAVAALILVVLIASLGIFIRFLTKSGATGWLYVQKPVLLVCSSEQSAHVSAVCALASILQGELSATVQMALCAQSSQRQTGAGTGVADLGPLPWLYGQWETVHEAQGKVLIIWSPEAKTTYEKWKKERVNVERNERKKEDERIRVDEDYKQNGSRLGKCKKEKAAGRKDSVKFCDDKDWYPQGESSSVIGPVFAAALASLQGTLQQCKRHGVAIVYFQGLGHSRDIPKALRGVPRYCLPQDFRGLIQELGGLERGTETGNYRWHCWPRLLRKVRSIWLARQLAHRLQTLVPQTQGKKMQGLSVTPSQKMISDKTQSGLKLRLAADMTKPETAQEQEPLRGSTRRAEEL